MIYSEGFSFRFRRKHALMYVMRNDGYCWGRIVFADQSAEFDVPAGRDDQYEQGDGEAADYFIERAKRSANVHPPCGWPMI